MICTFFWFSFYWGFLWAFLWKPLIFVLLPHNWIIQTPASSPLFIFSSIFIILISKLINMSKIKGVWSLSCWLIIGLFQELLLPLLFQELGSDWIKLNRFKMRKIKNPKLLWPEHLELKWWYHGPHIIYIWRGLMFLLSIPWPTKRQYLAPPQKREKKKYEIQ